MPTVPGNLGHSGRGPRRVHPTWKQPYHPEAEGGEATALFTSHKRGSRKQALIMIISPIATNAAAADRSLPSAF